MPPVADARLATHFAGPFGLVGRLADRDFDLGVEARVRRRVLFPFPVHLQPAVFFFDLDDVEGRVLGQLRR